MISHSHKFLFIQIPKTATSSIHTILDPYMEYDYTKISRHAEYSEVAEFYPESKNYFKFSFIRNPWDRLLSFFLFKKTDRSTYQIPKDMSLKNFIPTISGQVSKNQISYVDCLDEPFFLGRFENLQDDFDKICDTIGVSSCQLPLKNTTDHNHYTEYYDDETRRLVSEKYAKDIEYFNYKFGE